jgi:hypothetical protein
VIASGITLLLLDSEFNAISFCSIHGGAIILFNY